MFNAFKKLSGDIGMAFSVPFPIYNKNYKKVHIYTMVCLADTTFVYTYNNRYTKSKKQ